MCFINPYLPFWLGILMVLMVGCAPVISIPDSFVQTKTTDKEIPITKPSAVEAFQATVENNETEYRLGTGDSITVEVWGYPELSGKHIIGPDGHITLPLVGPILLNNLSRPQAAQAIMDQLAPYYLDLTVAVRVDNYASNRVLVLGRVSRPGEINFGMTTPTLLKAISLAGGFANASGLNGEAQTLPFTRCAIFRGRDQVIWVELEPLFTGQDLSLNMELQRNDVIYIPDIKEKLVYVLGEVRHPGAFPLTPQMSFLELLAKAGGPTRDGAMDNINVIRPNAGINQPIPLSQVIAPNQSINVALQEGDIIYVPTNMIAKINYAIQILNPFATILGVYANIESIRAETERRRLDQEEERLEAERAAIEAEKAANTGLE